MMKVVVFGLGVNGNQFITSAKRKNNIEIVGTVDTFRGGSNHISEINELDYDKVIITAADKSVAVEMKGSLIENSISEEKIEWLWGSRILLDMMFSVSKYTEDDIRVSWLRNYARFIHDNGIEGNVAECGVYRGDFAMYINEYFADRCLFLFDTFEGFTKEDIEIERDLKNEEFINSSYNTVKAFKGTSAEIVISRLPYKEKCVIKKGYFPETTADMGNEKFCFVNLDMDLYKPQLEGLKFFYDRMVPGGVILLHDYYCVELPGVKQAVDDFCKEMKNVTILPIGDECSIAVIKRV